MNSLKQQQGVAVIIVVLALLIMISATITAFVHTNLLAQRSYVSEQRHQQAFYAATAGINFSNQWARDNYSDVGDVFLISDISAADLAALNTQFQADGNFGSIISITYTPLTAQEDPTSQLYRTTVVGESADTITQHTASVLINRNRANAIAIPKPVRYSRSNF
tara:strand:- start:44867 stop:45358 length:492 start_codon:yes stop_codon:yes gene_type:complete